MYRFEHDGIGVIEDAKGRVRLSGAADLSKLFSDNVISFDCIFVIDLEEDEKDEEDGDDDDGDD